MEAEARICYYLGANAPTGFYSLYDQMLDPEKARDIRILKGGPGCGKSTLMKQVGRAMEEEGYSVEYIRWWTAPPPMWWSPNIPAWWRAMWIWGPAMTGRHSRRWGLN